MSKIELIKGNVLDVLKARRLAFGEKSTCLIADPPDNIGLGYNSYEDRLSDDEYDGFLADLVDLAGHVSDVAWISFNAKYLLDMGFITRIFQELNPEFECRVFIQTFTFGQNNRNDCGNGFRPILRLRHKRTPLYPEAIKVESWRQKNGDKRAAKGGKVPLDVWDFPRVTGNSKQRRAWHPTQLHEGLVKRMIDFSTKPGDSILDCFSGTGTVLRVAKDRDVTSIELDETYCHEIAKEHGLTPNEFQTRWSN